MATAGAAPLELRRDFIEAQDSLQVRKQCLTPRTQHWPLIGDRYAAADAIAVQLRHPSLSQRQRLGEVIRRRLAKTVIEI